MTRRLLRGGFAGALLGFVVILWSVFSLAASVRDDPDQDHTRTLGPVTVLNADVEGDLRTLSPDGGAGVVLLTAIVVGAGAALLVGMLLDRRHREDVETAAPSISR